jgi:hypothetical protein
MAADSLFFFVFACPGRNCILERTFFIQEQNDSARVLCFRVALRAMESFY